MEKLEVLALLFFAYVAGKNYGHPFIYALLFTIVSLVMTTISGGFIPNVTLINGVIILIFCSAYFWLVDHFSDNKILFAITLVCGLALWIGMPYLLEYTDMHIPKVLSLK